MNHKFKSTLKPGERFWRLLKPDAKEIKNVYVYSIFTGLLSLSLPLGIQAILNLIQGGQISASWIVLVTLVILGVAVSGILQIYQLRITENLQQKIFSRAALEFAYRVPRIKMEQLYNRYAPELMNRFFDVMTVQKGLSKILIDFSTAAFHIVFGLILLSFYHPFFILFSVVLIGLVFLIIKFTGAKGFKTALKESDRKYQVVYWLEELARTNTTFKLAGKTSLPMDKTDKHVLSYLNAREAHFKVLVRQYSLLLIFKVIIISGLLALGGILVMNQTMNIGQFVAAEIIIILVINSVEKLILSLETIYDVLTGLEKIGQVTDLELEGSGGVDITLNKSREGLKLELTEVSFAFPKSRRQVINDFSININQGEKIIVTGENGSGKSTLLHILAGLYEPVNGFISIDDLPVGNYDQSSLRSVIGDSLTQEQLFEGTIFENISMGRPNATIENVKWALEGLGLADFIKTQPQGYDTILEPLGKSLPKSTTQKLLVARSIADRPRLLLLEDALEHLENNEKRSIIDFLTAKDKPWTLVTVSSDPYFVNASEKVLEMKKGTVLFYGSNDKYKSFNS